MPRAMQSHVESTESLRGLSSAGELSPGCDSSHLTASSGSMGQLGQLQLPSLLFANIGVPPLVCWHHAGHGQRMASWRHAVASRSTQ